MDADPRLSYHQLHQQQRNTSPSISSITPTVINIDHHPQYSSHQHLNHLQLQQPPPLSYQHQQYHQQLHLQQTSSQTPTRSLHRSKAKLNAPNCCGGISGSGGPSQSGVSGTGAASATSGGGGGGGDGQNRSNYQGAGAGAGGTASCCSMIGCPMSGESNLRYRWHGCPELLKAMEGVTYIADHTKKEEESNKVYVFKMMPSMSHIALLNFSARSKKTGSSWQWCSIVCSYGFSQLPLWSALPESSCRRPRFMTPVSRST